MTRITAGYGSSYAWTSNGTLYAWGSNHSNGSLFGDPNMLAYLQLTPAPAPRLGKVEQLAPCYAHDCALRADQSVDCWGSNHEGQLGRPVDEPDRTDVVPAPAVELNGVVSLGRGFAHTCAIMRDANVRCWGRNEDGQLGDGTRTMSERPVEVRNLRDVKQVVGGTEHTCAITNDGAVYCWGDNSYGQLGDGTRTPRTSPVRVRGF